MLLYATEEDVVDWVGDQVDNVRPKLRAASLLVANAARAAVYAVDVTTGLPVLPVLATALKEATCAQVAMWAAAGIDPASAGVGITAPALVSKSRTLDGRSVSESYADLSTSVTVQQSRAQATQQLCLEAWTILQQAGLTSGQPSGC